LLVEGVFPANQWLDVKPSGCKGNSLLGQVSEVDLEPSSLRTA